MIQKKYLDRPLVHGKLLFALREDNCYDIYKEGSLCAFSADVAFAQEPCEDAKGNLYFWSCSRRGWKRLFGCDCFSIQTNAVVKTRGEAVNLYQIDADANARLIRSGKKGRYAVSRRNGEGYLLDDWFYPISESRGLVLFDEARQLTWKEKNFDF